MITQRHLYPFLLVLIIACSNLNINRAALEIQEPTITLSATSAPEDKKSYAIGLTSINDGLELLDSYQANIIVDFEGIRGGKSSSGRLESLVAVNRMAAALHYYLYVDAIIPQSQHTLGVSEFFRVADKVYILRPEESLSFNTKTNTLPGEMGFLMLDNLIVLPTNMANPPQPENLHGQKAQRYRFTERDLNISGIIFEQAKGDLWIAEENSYVLQYVISATVSIVTPLPNAHILDTGKVRLSYTLTDINTNLTVTPPHNIETTITPLANFPRPPNATITTVFPTLFEYTSTMNPISATLFYQNGLQTQGWIEEKAEVFEEKSRLVYTKESDTLTVIIAPTDAPSIIKVSLNLVER